MRYINPDNIRCIFALSLLSGKQTEIYLDDVQQEETMLLQILCDITTSSAVISSDGHTITFKPGSIEGGEHSFECVGNRGVGYYLEYLLLILPFAKFMTKLQLKGKFYNNIDLSPDYLQNVTIPHLHYQSEDPIFEMMINYQTSIVNLQVKQIQKFKVFDFTSYSPITLIKGQGLVFNINKQLVQRAITAYKQNMNNTCEMQFGVVNARHDVPGYGFTIALQSENRSVSGFEIFTGDVQAEPEVFGKYLAEQTKQLATGLGCVDFLSQNIIMISMGISEPAVCVCRVGKLHDNAIFAMRAMFEFFGVKYQLEDYEIRNKDGLVVSSGVEIVVRGAGVINVSQKGF